MHNKTSNKIPEISLDNGVDILPRVSIIIPSYNQGKFIERTILSVLNQSYANIELIIIDGGSADETIDIIKKYENKISYWVSEKDKGQSHALNKGVQKATGAYIGWINSDDIYFKETIKNCVDVLVNNPGFDVVFGNYVFIDESDKIIRTRKEIPFVFERYLWTNKCPHANVAGLFTKRCFTDFGKIREDLNYALDYEFYVRLGYNRIKFKHIRKYLGAYRYHSQSKTISNTRPMIIETKMLMDQFCKNYNMFSRLVLPPYYRMTRYIGKLITGCYFSRKPQHLI
jgi:glycosyltransferase involved in cell wall biosynthesis